MSAFASFFVAEGGNEREVYGQEAEKRLSAHETGGVPSLAIDTAPWICSSL
jgi:hypothetical protein